MIPILYESNETLFETNGLGRLADAVSCLVTEERNGEYVLEMEYPVSGLNFDQIRLGRVIAVTHDESGDVQPFDIYAISEPIDGIVTIEASHISYRLNEITVRPYTATSCLTAIKGIYDNAMNSCPFEFSTDKSVVKNFEVDVPRQARSILGGEEGSILDVYGTGEYLFDRFDVVLYTARGGDTEVSIRYGKNLIDFQNEINSQETYNAVAPYWKGSVEDEQTGESVETLVMLSGDGYVTSGYAVDSGRTVVVPMDLSDAWESAPSESDLRDEAESRLMASLAWRATQNVEVDFVQLWQTEEYKDFAALQNVKLCDTVLVDVPMYGIHGLRIKVIKVVWDALAERYDSMELGEPRSTLADTLTKQVDSKVATVQETANEAVETAANSVTSDTIHYLATDQASGVTVQTTGWTDTIQTMTAVKQYLWIYHTYTKANGGTTDTQPVIIGRYGQDGTSVTILGSYNTLAELQAAHPTGNIGDSYMVAGDLYVWNGSAWENVGQIQGPQGEGVTVSSTAVSYQQSTNGSTPPTGTWSSTAPAAVAGWYMWTRTIVTYSDGQTTTSYSVSKNGANGTNGTDGTSVTITSTSVRYQKSAVGTTPPTGTWSTSIPTTQAGDFLWTRTIVNYSDGTSTTSYSVSRNGLTGAEGVSVTGVTEHYLATSASSGVTKNTSGWTETVQTMTQTNQYLWNYETTYGSDGNVLNETDPVIIGRYGQNGAKGDKGDTGATGATGPQGAKGDTGDDGVSITGVVEWYQINASNSTPPATPTQAGTGYSTTPMATTTAKPYLWNYSVISYSSGSPTISAARVIGTHGATGPTGPQGAQGVSVTKVEPEYYMSTSPTQATGGQWDDELNYVAGRYIWTHEKITYSNGTVTYSTAIYNSALTQAWINAANAYQVATGLNQYIWNTTSGSDPGLHITLTEQDDFVDDPSGANLLATTNGLAVRDGLAELADFTADGIEFRQDSKRIVAMGNSTTTVNVGLTREVSLIMATGRSATYSDLANAATGTQIKLWTRFTNIDTGSTYDQILTYTKGTASYDHAVYYDGTSTLTNGNTDVSPITIKKIHYYKATTVPQLILGDVASDDDYAILVGNIFGSTNERTFGVDWEGNLEAMGGGSFLGDVSVSGDVTAGNIGEIMTASSSVAISSTSVSNVTYGAQIRVPAGVYVFLGEWTFNSGSTSGNRNMQVGIYRGTTELTTKRVLAAGNNWAKLQVVAIAELTSEINYIRVGAGTSIAYTSAQPTTITAIRLR